MEVLVGEALRRRILESYSKDPMGWSFVMSPSPTSGFFDAMVSGPEGAWMLKIDSLFKPSPMVLGSQSEPPLGRPEGPFPYGYRTLPPDLALQMMGAGVQERKTNVRSRLLSVLGSDPVVPVEGKSYAQGPLLLTGPGRVSLSDNQREIDSKLTTEMRRLMRMRYPAYG